MKFKKGFTLAEILIVLMVIGALATMTIPSLMKGVQEAQWKTAYKKAYNNIANIMATEKIASGLPAKRGKKNKKYVHDLLLQHLSIKAYVPYNASYIPGKMAAVPNTAISAGSAATSESFYWSLWLIAEDGLSYAVISPDEADCGTKAEINSKTTLDEAAATACEIIAVDVNGLAALPNKLATGGAASSIDASSKTPSIDGDQFYIYIGSDGATAGNPVNLLTGRIAGDIK